MTLTSLPPVLTPVEADTGVDLPHASWAAEWRPLLRRFGAEVPKMKPVQRVSYEPLPLRMRARVAWSKLKTGHEGRTLFTFTWHLPVSAVRDSGLRREMLQFAESFYNYELPSGDAVILTRMLDDVGLDNGLPLIAWLRAAVAQMAGEESSAIAAPTGQSGAGDGSFSMHSDMWIPALLFNVFNHAVPSQGASLLLPMDDMWEIAAQSGVPEDARQKMEAARVEAGECDYFSQFNNSLYGNHPWTPEVTRALSAAAIEVPMARGQGYFVNDREWLHGRTVLKADALPAELKEHRLYRLAYNNARLDAGATERRVEWDLVGRTAAGCKT